MIGYQVEVWSKGVNEHAHGNVAVVRTGLAEGHDSVIVGREISEGAGVDFGWIQCGPKTGTFQGNR